MTAVWQAPGSALPSRLRVADDFGLRSYLHLGTDVRAILLRLLDRALTSTS